MSLFVNNPSKPIVPSGCTVVRGNPHPGTGTVLVLGTPRGGTSVVAGICHMFGVSMGIDIDPSNMEDRVFQRLLGESDRRAQAEQYFAELSELSPLVGLKNPVIIDSLVEYFNFVRNPVLVVVSRDVYATAQREEISGSEFFQALQSVIRRKYATLDFVQSVTAPLLVVSYERLLLDTAGSVSAIGQFLVGNVSGELVARICPLIRPHANMPSEVNFLEEQKLLEKFGR